MARASAQRKGHTGGLHTERCPSEDLAQKFVAAMPACMWPLPCRSAFRGSRGAVARLSGRLETGRALLNDPHSVPSVLRTSAEWAFNLSGTSG